jgi:hypothetical protein
LLVSLVTPSQNVLGSIPVVYTLPVGFL